MAKSSFVELILTCGSWQEAQKIADHLLENQLVAYVEFMEVKMGETKALKLIMQTVADNFAKVEAAVRKLQGGKTFELQALSTARHSA